MHIVITEFKFPAIPGLRHGKFNIYPSIINFLTLFISIGFLSTFCFQANAEAASRHSNSTYHYPVDFSLSFSQQKLDLNSGNTTYSMKQRRISTKIINTVDDNLRYGLIVGSSFISQDNDAATEGLSVNGNHLGFLINGTFGDEFQIGLHAQYIYQEARGENELRTVTLSWHEWLTEATLQFRLGSHWAILGGWGISGVDADRRVRGDINETTNYKLDNKNQGRAAISLFTSPADKIQFTIYRGTFNGAQVSFEHAF